MKSSETGSETTMKSSGTSSETQAKSSGTSSEKTKKVRIKVSNNPKNMLVFPL